MKKRFGLLGFPINHSLSSFIHQELFKIKNFNASYSLFNIEERDLDDFLKGIDNLDGFNVTMPYKNIIYEKIKNKSETAKKFQTTNTIIKSNNEFKCYNTDNFGFLETLKHFEISLKNNTLLLGLGGAGKIVALNAIYSGSFLTVAVRPSSFLKAKNTLAHLIPNKFHKNFEIVNINKIPQKIYKTIVNATPIGMNTLKNHSPVSFKNLFGCKTAIDLIYSPKKTKFLLDAEKLKIKTINGLYMLIMQAIKANELFLNTKHKKDVIFKLYKTLNKI